MDAIFVDCVGEKLQITLGERRLERTAAEPAAKGLGRLAPKAPKSKRKNDSTAKSSLTPPVAKLLDATGDVIDDGMPSSEAWQRATTLLLPTNSEDTRQLTVRFNAPSVTSVECFGFPRVGIALRPVATTKHCTFADLQWRWLRKTSHEPIDDAWEPIDDATAASYTPTPLDVGVELAVEATSPTLDDERFVRALLDEPVADRVLRPDAEARLASMGPPSPDSVRVMSYNVLADAYRHTWDESIHQYLPRAKTEAQWRLPLAVQEVLELAPDMAALQEVDERWWERLWLPALQAVGYDGTLSLKSGGSREGCATVWRRDAWQRVATVDDDAIALSLGRMEGRELPELTPSPQITALLEACPQTAEAMRKIGSVAQLTLLESVSEPSRRLLVCNTHLFFAGRATSVRMIQAQLLLAEASRRIDVMVASGGKRPAILVLGDLNAEAHDGALRFFVEGGVSADDPDWCLGTTFRWGYASSRKAKALLLACFDEVLGADDDDDEAVILAAANAAQAITSSIDNVENDGSATTGTRMVELKGAVTTTRNKERDVLKLALAAAHRAHAREPASERSSRARACLGLLRSATAEAVTSERARFRTLPEALERGETYKTSLLVAAAQARADLGIGPSCKKADADSDGGDLARVLPLSEAENEACDTAIAALAVARDAEAAAALEVQRELVRKAGSEVCRTSVVGCGTALSHSFALSSAYPLDTPCTNLALARGAYWEAALDWILFDNAQLSLGRRAPLPAVDALKREHIGLPSAVFPSDHLSLCCDLRFASNGAFAIQLPMLADATVLSNDRNVVMVRPYYAAVFLTRESSAKLLNAMGGAAHSDVKADHVTLQFSPGAAELQTLVGNGTLGSRHRLRAHRVAATSSAVQAVRVVLPPECSALCRNDAPHVTLSIAPNASSSESNALLAGTPVGDDDADGLVVDGAIGVVVDVEMQSSGDASASSSSSSTRWLVVDPAVASQVLSMMMVN